MNLFVTAIVLAAIFAESMCGLVQQREEFECQKGMSYIENGCNTCFCVAESDLVCTISQCENDLNKKLRKCATGTTWYEDCNQCWCVNVGTVCTNYQCTA